MTGVYLLDFFCSGIQFYLLLSPYLCFISLLYLDLYVLGDDALISKGSFMQTKYLCVLIHIQGFFWPVLMTDIRSCSQCQKVCFFPNLNKKIPNSRNKKKTGEKITKYRQFTMFMFVVESAGPNSPNDTREITKYCKLPNGNVPLRQFSRIYSRRCRGVCNKALSPGPVPDS